MIMSPPGVVLHWVGMRGRCPVGRVCRVLQFHGREGQWPSWWPGWTRKRNHQTFDRAHGPGSPGAGKIEGHEGKREMESICVCGKGWGLKVRPGDQRSAAANF